MRDVRIASQIHTTPGPFDGLVHLPAELLAEAAVIWDPTVDVALLADQFAEVTDA